MEVTALKESIRALLSDTFIGRQVDDETDIFADGFGNSLFALQLVEFVEGECGIVFDSGDLEIDNFRSIDAISRLIERKVLDRP